LKDRAVYKALPVLPAHKGNKDQSAHKDRKALKALKALSERLALTARTV
jgi:hypothetical protein